MFGTRGRRVEVFTDPNLQSSLKPHQDLFTLATKTLYVMPKAEKPTPCNITSPVCHFSNVEVQAGGKSFKGTLLLENPRGATCTVEQLLAQVFEQNKKFSKYICCTKTKVLDLTNRWSFEMCKT